METFADLLDRLAYTPSRSGKLRLMRDYLAATPDPERGWALAVLTGSLKFRLPVRRILGDLLQGRVDPVLFALSRDYVGDTAETVALLWPEGSRKADPPSLATIVAALRGEDPRSLPLLLEDWFGRLDATGRWALLKLLTGALRVGVSARLAKTAAAQLGEEGVDAVEELWHSLEPPYTDLFAWLEGRGPKPEPGRRAVFRPLMLAHPIEPHELAGIDPRAFLAEWKWDGVRVQLAAAGDEVRLFSRSGDDITAAFPDVVDAFPRGAVLDGELLIVRDGQVAPFNDLQQRLNRKSVSTRMLRELPAHLRLYDMLFEGEEDLRPRALSERRERLIAWVARTRPPRADVSPLVPFADSAQLEELWSATRAAGIEGLMLKRRSSPYLPGRPKGHWYKWKRAPLTIDAVLMYAQRGSGRRSSYYSDYTFGAWREGEGGARELVPVGKAYFGFTDEELTALDRWIRSNTVERFGPVRAVAPKLVLEVAFDAVHASARHKSGVAMRFPRIHRIRWDKPTEEADDLATLLAMIES